MTEILTVLLLGTLGWLGWRSLRGGLVALGAHETDRRGLLLFVVGFLVVQLVAALAAGFGAHNDMPLRQLLLLQGLADGLAVAAIFFLAPPGSAERLGWRRHRGPPAPLLATTAWLAFLPVVLVVAWFNTVLLEALGEPHALQELLRRFLVEPDARTSPTVWMCAVVLLPACEEILYRGALHGGLRRVMPVPLAVVVSSLVFGLSHGSEAMLLTGAVGVLLALSYEKTGSLFVPFYVHALHNAVQLLMVSA